MPRNELQERRVETVAAVDGIDSETKSLQQGVVKYIGSTFVRLL